MIVVTHLLGTGHLARALTLGRAVQAAGHGAVIVSGGTPVPQLETAGLTFHQLPPLQSDGVNFANLLDDQGRPASAAHRARRIEMLSEILADTSPDVLITELFPFGRRNLRDEFQELLAAAKRQDRQPLICSSVRDILAPPSKPAKAAFAEEMIATYYDAILVHSDPAVTPLQASWPVTETIEAKLRYTGFVAPPPVERRSGGDGTGEILVSVGGGSVGQPVLEAALAAAGADSSLQWRLLIGGAEAKARAAAMAVRAPANAIVEPARPDFREMLYRVRASVSLCGYNTALDVLQAGCPAIFVPFDGGDEVEQTLRAKALSERPEISVLKTSEVSGKTLLTALRTVTRNRPERQPAPNMDGATRTVGLIETLLAGRS